MLGFFAMRYHEVKGHWPLMKAKKQSPEEESDVHSAASSGHGNGENRPVVSDKTEA